MRFLAPQLLALAMAVFAISGSATAPAMAAGDAQNPSGIRQSDPRGDARGGNEARRALADATGIRFDLTTRERGFAKITVKFRNLTPRKARGGLNQGFLTILRSGGQQYELVATRSKSRPQFRRTEGSESFRPEYAELTKSFGRGGNLTVTFSTEFLQGRRVHIKTVGISRNFANPDKNAFDNVLRGLFEFPG